MDGTPPPAKAHRWRTTRRRALVPRAARLVIRFLPLGCRTGRPASARGASGNGLATSRAGARLRSDGCGAGASPASIGGAVHVMGQGSGRPGGGRRLQRGRARPAHDDLPSLLGRVSYLALFVWFDFTVMVEACFVAGSKLARTSSPGWSWSRSTLAPSRVIAAESAIFTSWVPPADAAMVSECLSLSTDLSVPATSVAFCARSVAFGVGL